MKKDLLRCNAIFLGILFLIELFYAGFRAGISFGIRYALQSMEYYDFRIEELFLPAIYLLFWGFGLHAFRWHEHLKPKACGFLGILIFGYAALSWVVTLIAHSNNSLVVYVPTIEVWVYPVIKLLLSTWVFINCICCARQARQENKQCKLDNA